MPHDLPPWQTAAARYCCCRSWRNDGIWARIHTTPRERTRRHLWQFTDAPLLNRHFRDLEEREDGQLARCAALQEQPDRIRSATLFPWWPQRIRKRLDPRRT